MNRMEEAISSFSKAIEIVLGSSRSHVGRGVVFNSIMQYNYAVEDFSKAIEIAPNNASPYYNRANPVALEY